MDLIYEANGNTLTVQISIGDTRVKVIAVLGEPFSDDPILKKEKLVLIAPSFFAAFGSLDRFVRSSKLHPYRPRVRL